MIFKICRAPVCHRGYRLTIIYKIYIFCICCFIIIIRCRHETQPVICHEVTGSRSNVSPIKGVQASLVAGEKKYPVVVKNRYLHLITPLLFINFILYLANSAHYN